MRLLALLCLLFTGCASVSPSHFPLVSDPAVQYGPTELAIWIEAEDFAFVNGGEVYRIRSGSMIPTLFPGDYVVIDDEVPWADFVPYKIAQYQAAWLPSDAETVLHRIVGRDSAGLIMSGDANQFSESQYRVTEATAKGLLVAVWRISK